MGRNKWQRQMQNQNVNQPRVDPPYVTPMEPPVDPFVPHTISPTSDFPFTINVRDLFPNIGDDDQITVTSVREISSSEGPEDPTIIINDDGTITYGPTGTFLRNSLVVEAEVVPVAEGDDDDEEEAKTIEFFVPLAMDTVGNTEAYKTVFETQGFNGTCAGMAVGAVLKQNGTVEDQWQVLIDGTLVLGLNGERLNTPTLVRDDNDAPAYIVQLSTQEEVDRFQEDGIKWIGQNVDRQQLIDDGYYVEDSGGIVLQALEDYRMDFPRTTKIVPNTVKNAVAGVPVYFGAGKTAWTESFFDHYMQTGRVEYAVDFTSILIELYHGKPVLLRVDGAELRGMAQDAFNTVMSDNDNMAADVQSTSNHIVWLTHFTIIDGEPVFEVLDPAVAGGVRYYDMRQIIAAIEDGEFSYISVGERNAYLNQTLSYQSLAESIDPAYKSWVTGARRAADLYDQNSETETASEEAPLPPITNAKAMEITGRDTPEAAWQVIYGLIPLRLLDDYPDVAAALPNEAPLNNLSHMVGKLNQAKSAIYEAFGFDQETVDELLRSLDIE